MADQTKWCPHCEAERPISEFYVNNGRYDGLSGYCIRGMAEANARFRASLRAELLAVLGDRCTIPGCPNDDPRGWCVDHVNGGGRAERESGVWTASRAFVNRVKAHPDEYQILCAYHNQIKKIEEQEHTGRRVYERAIAIEKRQGVGKGNSEGGRNALAAYNQDSERQRQVSKQGWANATPEQREARKAKLQRSTVGRKLVTDPTTGKRHWSRPGDPDYPEPVSLADEAPSSKELWGTSEDPDDR